MEEKVTAKVSKRPEGQPRWRPEGEEEDGMGAMEEKRAKKEGSGSEKGGRGDNRGREGRQGAVDKVGEEWVGRRAGRREGMWPLSASASVTGH